MLGYNSPREWAEKPGFLDLYVEVKSQETLASAYWKAIEKMSASTSQLTLKTKDGAKMDSTMIIVPMLFEGHMFAVHFITNTVK
jgi:hypothetical protein